MCCMYKLMVTVTGSSGNIRILGVGVCIYPSFLVGGMERNQISDIIGPPKNSNIRFQTP